MSEWKAKRFWENVTVAPEDDGWSVKLDERSVKTPAKAALILPTERMAQAVALEWENQDGVVDPHSMPFTRSANSAIDKVRVQRTEVADMLAAYADADLLCYRAESPEALMARQAEVWDPYLEWARNTFDVRLEPRAGVIHHPQNPEALLRLSEETHALSDFALAAFHDLVSLSGSIILGFAAARNTRPLPEIWAASRLDELWQEEQWGSDEEAQEAALIKENAFVHAKSFFDAAEDV